MEAFLGFETAEALMEAGLDVSLLISSKQILRNFDPDIAYHVHKYCTQKGLKIYTSENITRFDADEKGNVKTVITTNKTIETDLVIIAKGTQPNIELARDAGIKIGSAGAIQVNEYLETSVKNIYAGGDCAEVINLINNKPVSYSSGSIANKHGRVIGENVCGKKSTFKGAIRSRILKIFDMTLGITGFTEKEAKQEGYEFECVIVPGFAKAHLYPGVERIIIKMITEKASRQIIGVQIYGLGNVSKRIDVAAVAITAKMTVDDLGQADLAYAPPYSPAMDTIIVAANVLSNKLSGKAKNYFT